MITPDEDSELNELYKKTSKELPPFDLDKAIIAKARGPRKNPWVEWKAIASTAAVITLSVYIFIDVEKNQYETLEEQISAPQLDVMSAPVAKKVLSNPPRPNETLTSDSIASPLREQTTMKSNPINRSKITNSISNDSLYAGADTLDQELSDNLELESKIEPSDQIIQIKSLIDQGKLKQAQSLYKALLQDHPSYAVPDEISRHFE